MSFAALIPAAGSSTRFGAGRNKLAADLAGQPVLGLTLDAFLRRPDCALVVLAASPALEQWLHEDDRMRSHLERAGERIRLCRGGASRAESVRNALSVVPQAIEWVAVHDAARPLISQQLIDATLAAAKVHGAAVPALPVNLTVKQAAGPLPAAVVRTIPRHDLWAMQTPQIMRRADLLDAFDRCPLPPDAITDDAQLLELAGKPVWLVPGEERNLKITAALDLLVAGAVWQQNT